MALPAIVWAALAIGAFFAFSEASASESKPGGTGPGGGGGKLDPNLEPMLTVMPNGVLVVKPEFQAVLLQALAQKSCAPTTDPNVVNVSPPLGAMTGGQLNPAAIYWIAQMAQAGRHVLMSVTGATLLRTCLPGEEIELANVARSEWAILVEAYSKAVSPGVPGGIPGGTAQPPQGPTIPGSVVIPQGPGGEVPPQQGTTIPLPGGGGIVIPGMPGGLPGLDGLGFPGGIPGIPGIPGFPGGTTEPGGTTGPETYPITHVFTIRPGDIPSKLAQWYTGNFMRAQELVPLNGLTVHGSGSSTYYTPWNVGQKVKLPLDWNVAKGLPPQQGGGGGGGGQVAGDDLELAHALAAQMLAEQGIG